MKKIFIIEDDAFLIKAYQIKFAKEGFDVAVATDGKEAIAMLSTIDPCPVMLDLILPGASGFEVLTAIRNDARWKSVPVVVLSNLSQSQDMDKAKALGVTDYIIKANTRINDIVAMVNKLTVNS
jgi:PleD family two-component response regulator